MDVTGNKISPQRAIFYIKMILIFLIPHRSLEPRGLQHPVVAIHYGILLMYIGQKIPLAPLTDHTPTKLTRNQEIRERYAQGETIVNPAEAFEISEQRISQVLRGRRH
jgi:Mor family transcriptional regulator